MKITGAIQSLSAGEKLGTHFHCLSAVAFDVRQSIRSGERPPFGVRIKGISHLGSSHFFSKSLFERVRNTFGDDKPFGGDAGLSVIENVGCHSCRGRHAQVGAVHDDEWGVSSQFQDHFLDSLCGANANFDADCFAHEPRTMGERQEREAQEDIDSFLKFGVELRVGKRLEGFDLLSRCGVNGCDCHGLASAACEVWRERKRKGKARRGLV
jgi:hypothetical protein